MISGPKDLNLFINIFVKDWSKMNIRVSCSMEHCLKLIKNCSGMEIALVGVTGPPTQHFNLPVLKAHVQRQLRHQPCMNAHCTSQG